MKKKTSLLFFAAVGFLFGSCGPKHNFSGTVTGVENDTVLVFINDLAARKQIRVDTVALVENRFGIQVPDTVVLGIQVLPKPSANAAMRMATSGPLYFLPGDRMKVEGETNDLKASGTVLYDGLAKLDKITNIQNRLRELSQEFSKSYQEKNQQAIDSLRTILMEQSDSLAAAKLEAIKAQPNSVVSGFLSLYLPAQMGIEAIETLSEEVKNGPFAALIEASKSGYESTIAKEKAKENIQPGKPAPDFKLKNLNNEEMTLASFNGKYLLLDFWGTWCGWCIKGIPDMKKYYDKYSKKIEFVGICCGDPEEKWRAGVAEHKLPWVNLYNGNQHEITTNYAITGYPTKILIDPEGKIVEVFVGESPAMYEKLDELFK